MTISRVHTWWERLLNADHATKRRAVIVGSAAIMSVVMVVWLAYFNSLVRVATVTDAAPAAELIDAGPRTSFWGTMRAGVGVIFEGLTHTLSSLVGPREIRITPGENN